MTQVMMLDPGKMTGIAIYDDGNFISWQVPMAEAGEHVSRWCESAGEHAAIGWEQFNITAVTYRMPEASTAIEVIGIARHYALRHGIRIISPRSRAARKPYPPWLMKEIGWHAPGQLHADDAARHLLAYLVTSASLPSQFRDRISSLIEERGERAIRGAAGE